jgi:hypothetical protein
MVRVNWAIIGFRLTLFSHYDSAYWEVGEVVRGSRCVISDELLRVNWSSCLVSAALHLEAHCSSASFGNSISAFVVQYMALCLHGKMVLLQLS